MIRPLANLSTQGSGSAGDIFGIALLRSLGLISVGWSHVPRPECSALQAAQYRGLLLQCGNRAPELRLRDFSLRCRKGPRGKLMTDMATEVADLRQVNLSHAATAIWAAESGELGLVLPKVARIGTLDHFHVRPPSCLVHHRIAVQRPRHIHAMTDLVG
jgi:hypothetical protein